MKDIFVIIPTLDPDEKIMGKFIDELKKEFKNILVVNDGSKKIHDKFFSSLENDGIIVFKHYKNFGKGRGIKNAFNYILNEYPNVLGAITADSDGQHSVKDIKRCAEALIKNPDKLILGVRDFEKDYVPKKSKFGNKITRDIFKIFIGLEISDTQTGLRGFSKTLMNEFIATNGERYEYETNMLIDCKDKNIKIEEIAIDTIYLNSNANSHFNPLKDSIKIYSLFLKYFFGAISSFLLDIIIFWSLFSVLNINSKILAATILARSVSSIYNYFINSNLIFKDMNIKTFLKYYILVFIQVFVSGCFVTYLFELLNIHVIIIKIIVDFLLWCFNVVIQRKFVFTGSKNE